MPNKHGQYDSISEDPYDACIPLYNEIAFQHGIHFEAKSHFYIDHSMLGKLNR
ncbi:Dystrophin-like protein 1 [Trichinella pseudospiralis]|uniref:Dystrophin-like protein 1 n=1 Tax=Trichinella pseudospiralis TaxID=6337 RepID=A0A0V1F7A7_TRIPS|nr:Dystrophin-like protein 1 [Trichinella pseudospiralis]